jgi:hypothetical protein
MFIPTAYEDGTECSEMLPFKLQMPVNHPQRKHTTPYLFFVALSQISFAVRLCEVSIAAGITVFLILYNSIVSQCVLSLWCDKIYSYHQNCTVGNSDHQL